MPSLQDTSNNALKIKNLTALVRLLLSDLKDGCAPSDTLFKEQLNINYIEKAYEIYEEKVNSICPTPFKAIVLLYFHYLIKPLDLCFQFFKQLTALIRNVVEDISAGLKQVSFSEGSAKDGENEITSVTESLTVGTNLFELYLALQSFSQ